LNTRQNLSAKDAQQMQTGVTSGDEVLLRFGEPDGTFAQGGASSTSGATSSRGSSPAPAR